MTNSCPSQGHPPALARSIRWARDSADRERALARLAWLHNSRFDRARVSDGGDYRMEDEPLHLMIVGPLKEALEQAAIADGRTVDDFVAAKLREAVPSEFASATRKAIDRRSKEEWDRHEKVLSDVLDKHFR